MGNLKRSGPWLSTLLIWLFMGIISPGWADNTHGVMHPDRQTRIKWFQAYENAPRAYIDKKLMSAIPPKGSLSLLSHLDYIPSQQNQGWCGNCWAWAGTGVLGIALDVQNSIHDRLSVQYINSCEGTAIGKTCCDGGWLEDLAAFYNTPGYLQALPWSNSNANWQDGDASCDTSCPSISTSPNYPISSISAVTITTHGVGQATAIANIKNVLNQNKAVWFAFFMPTATDGNNFFSFWDSQGEAVTWNPNYSCGHTWNNGWGHAVLCVGYNDDDPNNPYWIMVNSWGTTTGRPNGIFHVSMNMNYDCYYNDQGSWYSLYWSTLNVTFNTVNPDLVVTDIQTAPKDPEPNHSFNAFVTVKNQGAKATAGNFYVDWYANRATPPGPGLIGDRYTQVTQSIAPGASYTTPAMNFSGYTGTGRYQMAAQVDTDSQVKESNENNNVFWPKFEFAGVCECDLTYGGVCNMSDWLLFGKAWGRKDCNNQGIFCECDLNTDGSCNMSDWLLFGQDWGRSNCPIKSYCQSFSTSPAPGWLDDGSGRWSVLGGAYVMDGTGADSWASSSFISEEWGNFTYTADVSRVSGEVDYNNAIIFRADPAMNNYYMFGTTNGGYYMLIKYVGGVLNWIILWTQTSALNTGLGAVNKLKVVCRKDIITLYINNTLIDSVYDSSFSSGRIGVMCYDVMATDEVHYDNLCVNPDTSQSVLPTTTGRSITTDRLKPERSPR